MDRTLLMRLIRYPPIGKLVLNSMKKNVLRSHKIPLDVAAEKQEKLLHKKFKRLEDTEIGKKLGVRPGIDLRNLPLTNYDFYDPFFNSPSQNTLMYPLEEYERIRTSGTSGKEKWFMIPRSYINKTIIETAIPVFMLSTHNGERLAMEYGDTIYVNTAPRPFLGGSMASVASGEKEKPPLFNVVPNFNIAFEDKVKYFINNSNSIDIAATQASILVSQIMPSIKHSVSLKGLFCMDTAIAEAYFKEITEAMGTTPKTTYGSTETLFCSLPSLQYPLGFFLDWRRGIFEFIPIRKEASCEKETLKLSEVKVGEAYRIVFTSLETDLTRYDTACSFEVVGKGDNLLGIDLPIFKFQARLEENISLHNFTRISEDELITVFKKSGIQFVEFTTRINLVEGLEYLVVFLETTERLDKKAALDSVHRELCKVDHDYNELTRFYNYVPIRVNFLPRGVFGKHLMGKMATMSKVARIGMSDEEFAGLVQIAKSVDPSWQPK